MNNPEPGDKQMCEDLKRKLEEADRRIADLLQKLEKAEAGVTCLSVLLPEADRAR